MSQENEHIDVDMPTLEEQILEAMHDTYNGEELENFRNAGFNLDTENLHDVKRATSELNRGTAATRRRNSVGQADLSESLKNQSSLWVNYKPVVSPHRVGIFKNDTHREHTFLIAATASNFLETISPHPTYANIKQLGNAMGMSTDKILKKFGKEGAEDFVYTVSWIGRYLHAKSASTLSHTLNAHLKKI